MPFAPTFPISGTLDTPFVNDLPTLADIELMRTAYNNLMTVLKRP